jgi:hypothetical protein
MAGRQLARLAVDRQRRRNPVQREVGLDRVEVDRSREARLRDERLELRGPRQHAADVPPVQGLDPEAVATHDEPPARRVPQGEGEHAAQAPGEREPVLLVEMDEDLGVAVVGAEPMPLGLELATQLGVVVDLAVVDDDHLAGLVGDRLLAAGQVDDRQAAHGQPDPVGAPDARAVRPAVHERLVHGLERRPLDRATSQVGDAADAAHAVAVTRPARTGPGRRSTRAADLPIGLVQGRSRPRRLS